MSEETRRILEMVSEHKITIEEAERLLLALADGRDEIDASREGGQSRSPKYLKMIAGNETTQETFRMKVPLSLIRAGIKLKALIPDEARKRTVDGLQAKGIDIDPFELPSEQIDEFIRTFGELEIEGNDGGDHFRLYTE